MKYSYLLRMALLALIGWIAAPLLAAPVILRLTPSLPSPQPVGTTITWQTTAADTDPGSLNYRYNVIAGSSNYMVRDYSLSNSFQFTPAATEGQYRIQVTVRNTNTNRTTQTSAVFYVTSRVVNGNAVVTATPNPLVALLSAPSCSARSYMRGIYRLQGATTWNATYWKPCQPPTSMNFYIAGMRASTNTLIDYQVWNGITLTTGPKFLLFHSGNLTITPPATKILVPPNLKDDLAFGMILHDYLGTAVQSEFPVATDLLGNVMWYYGALNDPTQDNALLARPLAGGTMLLIVNGLNSSNPSVTQDQILREIDLAGNTLRETNVTIVGQQLTAMRILHRGQVLTSFHHDAIRLPNGNTAVLASEEKIFPSGTQGSTDPLGVDIIGDVIAVLDNNWQVVWGWNSFDKLDISRAAVLGEVCADGLPGCPPLVLASQTSTDTANDWLHGNSLFYIPSSGDLLLSLRHQDWVVKIDYANGSGTGNVLWRLGMGGDFQMHSRDPYPWFSHQHDVAFENGGTTLLSLFDNGNTRVAQNPGQVENSRGQILKIDEAHKRVSLVLNADLGVYSFALGSAQLLPNGNANFQPGIVGSDTDSYTIEVLPNGTISYSMQSGPTGVSYRSWRMPDLYHPPSQ